jgi:hypothetical protein
VPLTTLKLLPGVNVEVTGVLGEAQIVSSQLIRFRYAGNDILPEKLGGWNRYIPVSMGSPVRDLHAWEGISADTHLAAGCTGSLNIITDGVVNDVTPRTEISNPVVSFTTVAGSSTVTIDDASFVTSPYDSIYLNTPVAVGGLVLQGGYQIITTVDADTYTINAGINAPGNATAGGAVPSFATTINSPTVTVTLIAHGYTIGQLFNIPLTTATTVGGITLSGAYIVQSTPTADTFTINASQSATGTATGAMNGGMAQIVYYVGIGPSVPYSGYGTGTYGSGAYGLGIVPTPSSGSPITTTNWTLDNWGEVLLACPANGPIYTYSTDSGLSVADKIVSAPEINGGIFVSQPAQILVAWASSQGGVQDPLTVNWSDAGDYTNWIVSSTTQAGGYRLPTGSRIVGGLAGPNFGVIWTDVDVWAMDYIEPPLIFGFNSLGTNCGLLSRHGAAVLNSTVYWISNKKFCLLNGETVQTIPCTVWDFIFQDIDEANVDKIYAGSNSLFNEVWFFFPSASGGTGEVDSYVKVNVQGGNYIWDSGRLSRTAWIDQSPVGAPVAGDPSGYIYQHEVSPDADGQPLNAWFVTGYFKVNDGENLNFIDWVFPDFKYGYSGGAQSAIVQVTINMTDYPNQTPWSRGPYSVSSVTPYVNTRIRGRYASMRFESNDLGSFWRLGAPQIRSVQDGKR